MRLMGNESVSCVFELVITIVIAEHGHPDEQYGNSPCERVIGILV